MNKRESLKTITTAISLMENGYKKVSSHDLLSIGFCPWNLSKRRSKRAIKKQLIASLKEVKRQLELLKEPS